jgi:RHH-type transcriptional regulator, rel operon repressor / antitoxin RelB
MQRGTSVNLRIQPATKERLERLARATKRSKSYLVEAAIENYLDLNEWQMKEIEKGLKEVEEGQLTPHDEVLAHWSSHPRPLTLPVQKTESGEGG